MVSVIVYPEKHGQHIHVRIFAGPDEQHRSLAGRLIFRVDEWEVFGSALSTYGFRIEPMKDFTYKIEI